VPEGATLTIPENMTLTIPKGITLTNDGTIKNNGRLEGDGTFSGTGSGSCTSGAGHKPGTTCPLCHTCIAGIASYQPESKAAMVNVPAGGTYIVLFADYEGDMLAHVQTVPVTGDEQVTQKPVLLTENFNLSTGDKVMFWNNISNRKPICPAYIIK